MYVSTLFNILSSANQFVFLSKSICFPQQINLFSSANQFVLLNYMTFAAMLNDVLDDVEWRSRWCWVTLMTMQFQWVWSANSLNFLSKFIEIGQQIHWVCWTIWHLWVFNLLYTNRLRHIKKPLKNRVSGRYATHCLLKQLSATAEKWCGMKEKQSPTNSVSETEKSRGYQLFGVEKL